MSDWSGELTDLEARASLDSLQGLQEERRQLLSEYSRLRVLHGPSNRWDNLRKNMLSATKIRARMVCEAGQKKITDSLIDDMAHADEQYIRFVDEGVDGAVKYIEAQNKMDELNERIRNREFSMTAYSRELSLQPMRSGLP